MRCEHSHTTVAQPVHAELAVDRVGQQESLAQARMQLRVVDDVLGGVGPEEAHEPRRVAGDLGRLGEHDVAPHPLARGSEQLA